MISTKLNGIIIFLSLGLAWCFQSRFLSTSFLVQQRRRHQIRHLSSSSSSPSFSFDPQRQNDRFSLKGDDELSVKNAQSSSGLTSSTPNLTRRRIQSRDVVIVGGGLAGLSAALYLSQIDPERHISILDREDPQTRDKKTSTVASYAAAGMLAPQSERLPKGYLLDICMASRRMFPEFCSLVESLAKESGQDGQRFLAKDDKDSKLEPWNIGYVASGGFLAPAFAGDAVATWAPPDDFGTATWLDATQARELEPNLHPDIVGGWWFPEDASVDSVRLTGSLRAACVAAGVQILSGSDYEVSSLDLSDGECRGLWLKNGLYIKGNSILIANGAWMRNLLPVPIEPHKGQSLSLRMPVNQPPLLRRVLFAQDSYIVPKADGRIIVGATVEAGSYDPHITPAGLLHILSHAIQLMPALKDLPIEETWAGLRPTTPDKGPILGKTPWKNLFLAGGYWRNGVLLAPKTGQLMASLISGKAPLSQQDEEFLQAFSWDRFTSRERSTVLAASSRYAASMHPIHSRKSGTGVAASVGTELGFYSTAKSAKEEREADRRSLMLGGSDDAFERAAAMGKQDATAFSLGDDQKSAHKEPATVVLDDDDDTGWETSTFEGSADAYTVGSASSTAESNDDLDLNTMYQKIQENKAKRSPKLEEEDDNEDNDEERPDPGFRIQHVDSVTGEMTEVPPYTSPGEFLVNREKEKTDSKSLSPPSELSAAYEAIQKNKAQKSAKLQDTADESDEEKPDPGFRIHHVDSVTGEKREVPPYTSPGEFLATLKTEQSSGKSIEEDVSSLTTSVNGSSAASQYNEKTYDGYTDIQQANTRQTRQGELEVMRAARQRNRLGMSKISEDDIGARRPEDPE